LGDQNSSLTGTGTATATLMLEARGLFVLLFVKMAGTNCAKDGCQNGGRWNAHVDCSAVKYCEESGTSQVKNLAFSVLVSCSRARTVALSRARSRRRFLFSFSLSLSSLFSLSPALARARALSLSLLFSLFLSVV